MFKRIITLFAAALIVTLTSCSLTTVTVKKATPDKNTNKTNSIKINKTKIDKDIRLSPYYEPITCDTGYKSLDNDNEKRVYNSIVEHIDDFTDGSKDEEGNYVITTFSLVDCPLSSREISKVFFAIELDKPEFFWLAGPYSYSVSQNGDFSLTISSNITYDQMHKRRGQLNSVINSVLKGLKKNMSEFERELYIHDYLVKNCVYQDKKSKDYDRYTIYGCLVEQSAVCEGYKNAFQLLLSYCGIKSYGVSGSLKDSSNVDHVWNAVRIDGDYYYTDVTWDDAEDIVMYDYFNLTSKELSHSHSIAEKFDDVADSEDFSSAEILNYNLAVPKCTAVEYNYYRFMGTEVSSMSDNYIVEDLAEAALNGDDYFYITIDKKLNYNTIYNQLFSDDIFLFSEYIDEANSLLGYDALQTSVSVLKRGWLRTMVVVLNYN